MTDLAATAELMAALSATDLRRGAAMVSPADFGVYASRGRYTIPKHIELIDRYLRDIIFGKLRRLMVFLPPRHGKSELISHYLPCVFLGLNPERRVMLASYEADFASQWGWKARNDFSEYGGELWGLSVDQTSSARDRWDIAGHTGGMTTSGALGAMTGRGSDLLLLDDVLKNDQEANSATYRERLWDWWNSTASTRVEPGGAVVLMLTRWHEDDLAGRIIKDQPDAWTVISLPALAEANDPLGRAPGEPLWPERWSLDELARKRRDSGSYYWSALYQQRPAPEEGAVFRRQWFRYYSNGGANYKLRARKDGDSSMEVPVDKCWRFATVDLAASLKDAADYTVVATWAVTPQRQLLLLDCVRQKLEGPDQIATLQRVYEKQKPGYFLVEHVGYQLTMIQGARRAGLPVREGKVDKDKLSRALPASARMESGDVYLPESAAWLGDFESELLSFPRGEHDDQVDTLSAAVSEITRRGQQVIG